MSTEVKRRRGNTSQHSSFIGAIGEVTVDTDKKVTVTHDGSTSGGFPTLREDLNNLSIGSGLSKSGGTSGSVTLNIDNPFDPNETYANLRARGTTASDVGLGNVPNYNYITGLNLSRSTNSLPYEALDADTLNTVGEFRFVRPSGAGSTNFPTSDRLYYFGAGGGDTANRGLQLVWASSSNGFWYRSDAPSSGVWRKVWDSGNLNPNDFYTANDNVSFNTGSFSGNITMNSGGRAVRIFQDASGTGNRAGIIFDVDSADGIGIGSDYLMIVQDGVSNSIIQTPTVGSGDLNIQTGSTNLMTVKGSGNVGIGTTSPDEKTHIYGANPFLKIGHNALDAGTIGIKFNHYYTTASRNKTAIISDSRNSWGRADLHLVVDTASDNNQYTLGSDTKLFIDGLNGNVGISRTNPSYTLDVNGTGRFTGNLYANGTNKVWHEGNDGNGSGLSADYLGGVYTTNGSRDLIAYGHRVMVTFDTNDGDYLALNYNTDLGNGVRTYGRLNVLNGDVTVGSNIRLETSTGISKASDHQDPSDRRIKTDIVEHNPLDIAKHATLYKYNKRGLIQYGVMAQDLMEYDEQIVGTSSDDEFGEIYTLSGYSLGAIALAGVGSLDKKYESKTEKLERRVQELEEKVRQLGGVV